MLFKPIPKKLLIHEVTYVEPKKENDGSMSSDSTPTQTVIKCVRFAPTRKKVTLPDNTETYTNGVLFIDAVNSEPFINVSESGTIIFRGKTLKIIASLEAFADKDTPHHLEVQLQ